MLDTEGRRETYIRLCAVVGENKDEKARQEVGNEKYSYYSYSSDDDDSS